VGQRTRKANQGLAGGKAGPANALPRERWEPALRRKPALSALAWVGKSRSALPAMKVCLFRNPGLWTTGRHQKGPHRRCFKVSSDRRLAAEPTGLVTSRVPSRLPRHSEERGTPT